MALWAMPLDEYAVLDLQTDIYAEQLLVRPCLADAGYDWPVPWQDVTAPPPEGMSPGGRRLFDEDLARQWGYRSPPDTSGNAVAWDAFEQQVSALNRDEAFNAVMMRCLSKVREEHPLLQEERDFVFALTSRAFQEAIVHPDLTAAATRWRDCMAPLGIASLPDSPFAMPTPELMQQFGFPPNVDRQPRPEDSVPSPQEVEVAVADAACRESSGFTSVVYEAEWAAQTRLIAEERVTLDRNRAALEAREDEMLRLIAQNAPPSA